MTSGLINGTPGDLHLLQKVRILDGGFHQQVHGPPKEPAESFQQPEAGVRTGVESRLLEFDYKVQVAFIGTVRPRCGRPEQVESLDSAIETETLQLVGMFLYPATAATSTTVAGHRGRGAGSPYSCKFSM